MKYYIGVVGSRGYDDYNELKRILDDHIEFLKCTSLKKLKIIIVSGGAEGADKLAERYAKSRRLKTKIYLPDWSFGGRGGPIRNQNIVKKSNEIFAFWDGVSPGTQSTIKIANQKKVKIFVYS